MKLLPYSPDIRDSWLAKSVAGLALYTLLFNVFGGAARYLFMTEHIFFLDHLPNILCWILFGASFIHALSRWSMPRFMICLGFIVIGYICYVPFSTTTVMQALFGFYIWSPFLLGVLLCVYEQEKTVFNFIPYLWAIALAGIAINYFYAYPWIGIDYDVNGFSMQISREWTTGGVPRLPGLSRGSSAAAGFLLLSFGYILFAMRISLWRKMAAWFLSCAAIYLTTSKTELALALLFPGLLFLYRLTEKDKTNRLHLLFSTGIIALFAALVILLPLTLSTHKYYTLSKNQFGFLTIDTFKERMTQMWPEALDELDKWGNPIIGRGVGGIGIAQTYDDPAPERVNAADNLFLFTYVSAGWLLAIPFFLSFLLNNRRLYAGPAPYFDAVFIWRLCILGIGITTNVIEDPIMALAAGFLVARGYMKPPADLHAALC